MANKGLLFIPDITGFSRFVNDIEIEHGRLIIQELLETIINSNQIGLQVSEVEGDAILFYKFGDPPAIDDLYRQVQETFCTFHSTLLAYDSFRYCQCKACTSASGLTLKVISHYGEFTQYQVKEFQKLIGKDVIVAHQLLKNDINPHEYWLVTDNVLSNKEQLPTTFQWRSNIFPADGRNVSYFYTQLSALKEKVKPPLPPLSNLDELILALSLQREFDTDIITLFHATGDFNHRHHWREGVKKVEEVNHFLPRVGMKCRCIGENGESYIYSTSYSYSETRIEFTETDESDQSVTGYLLERIDDKRTRLTISYYIRSKFSSKIKLAFGGRAKLKANLDKSLDKLSHYVRELKIPGVVST